jgi:hypothetical protein
MGSISRRIVASVADVVCKLPKYIRADAKSAKPPGLPRSSTPNSTAKSPYGLLIYEDLPSQGHYSGNARVGLTKSAMLYRGFAPMMSRSAIGRWWPPGCSRHRRRWSNRRRTSRPGARDHTTLRSAGHALKWSSLRLNLTGGRCCHQKRRAGDGSDAAAPGQAFLVR